MTYEESIEILKKSRECEKSLDMTSGYCSVICQECKYMVKDHELTEASDTIIEYAEKYRWHNLREKPNDLPPVETEVDIVCLRGGKNEIRTHGFYEDGSVHSEESEWCWNELYEWAGYCEETDDYIIPEGWWEYRHYNPDDYYNNLIDDVVIAWRHIEPSGEEV